MSLLSFLNFPVLVMMVLSSITIIDYTHVSGFKNPVDPDVAIMEYNSSFYSTSLHSAWTNAQKAKEESFKISFSLNTENRSISFTVINTHYENAMQASKDTLSQMKMQLASDIMMLERIGIDHNKSEGVPRQKYERMKGIAQSFQTVDFSACSRNQEDIFNRIICVQSVKTLRVADGVKVYNAILSPYDRTSVLNQMHELHREAAAISKAMHDAYNAELKAYDRSLKESDRLSELASKKDFFDITPENQIRIRMEKSSIIISEESGTFAERISRASSRKSEAVFLKAHAEKVFSEKKEDYLIISILKMKESNSLLEKSVNDMSVMEHEAEEIRKAGKIQLRQLLHEFPDTADVFYREASDLYEKADSQNTGKAIVSYSEGIELIRLLNSNDFDYEKRFIYADKLADSLNSLGYDVSFEKSRISDLKKAKTSKALKNAYSELGIIIESMKIKIKPYEESIRSKRTESMQLLSSADLFLSEHFDSSAWAKTQSFKSEFEVSLSKDVYSNAFSLATLYDGIIDYYTFFFSQKSSEYIEKSSSVNLFFISPPECNKEAEAEVLIEVENMLPVQIRDASAEKEVIGNKIVFTVPFLEQGKKHVFKSEIKSVFLKCSEQKNSEINGFHTAVIEIEPVFPLKEAVIFFNIPREIEAVSVFPYSDIHEGVYLAKEISSPHEIIIQYRLSDSVFFSEPLEFSSHSIDEAESAAIMHNKMQDVCFFTECLDDFKATPENLEEAEKQLALKTSEAISDISGFKASEDIARIKSLLKDLSKATDTETDLLISRDYSYYGDIYESMLLKSKEVENYFTEFKSSGENVFEHYSKQDIKKYLEMKGSLQSEAESSLFSLREKAKEKLNESVSYYEKNPKETSDLMNSAKENYENGYYAKSIIYSDFIKDNHSKNSAFPFQYVGLAFLVGGVGIYIAKKPRKKQAVKAQALKRLKTI